MLNPKNDKKSLYKSIKNLADGKSENSSKAKGFIEQMNRIKQSQNNGQNVENALEQWYSNVGTYLNSLKVSNKQNTQSKNSNHLNMSVSNQQGNLSTGEKALRTDYKKFKAKYASMPDGTYDIDTGKPVTYSSGYQISFEQTSDNYSQDEYNKLIDEFKKITGSGVHAGVYAGDPEISFHCKDKATAMQLMKKYNQHTCLDWKKKNQWANNPSIRKKYPIEVEYILMLNKNMDSSKNNINVSKIGGKKK